MLEAVDKVDSARLTREEILDPPDWVLLGLMMDSRTGLGRFRTRRRRRRPDVVVGQRKQRQRKRREQRQR